MKPPSSQGKYVDCPDLFGQVSSYPAAEVRFRPAGYGILRHQGRILMVRSRFTGLWDFPGGGVEPFEDLSEGMAREFQEETGLRVVGLRLAHVAEGYIAMFGHPYHSLRFYFDCQLQSGRPDQARLDPGEVTELQWFGREEVPKDQMHHSDWEALVHCLTDAKGL